MRAYLLPVLSLVLGCSGEVHLDGPETDVEPDVVETDVESDVPVETDVVESDVPVETDTEPPIDPRYDFAELVVVQPEPASIHLLEDGIPLQGHVEAEDGTVMPVDLTWEIARDTLVGNDTAFTGAAGIYDVIVSVRLPNGDRLHETIGGVRLQSAYTGVWAGSVHLSGHTSYQGQAVQADCIGPFDFEVGMAGRVLEGSGGCTLALVVTSPLDLTFDVDGTVRGAKVDGSLGFNASILQIPVGWNGRFADPDHLDGAFSANLWVAQIDATLSAHKLSPYTTP
jgi:hypothetical protein